METTLHLRNIDSMTQCLYHARSHFPFFRPAIIIAIRRNPVQVLTEGKPGQERTSFLSGLAPVRPSWASPSPVFSQLCHVAFSWEAL